MSSSEQDQQIVSETREWLEKVVIGLQLCPFAGAVHEKNLIRYAVSHATTEQQLLADLHNELHALEQAHPEHIDTTLLIHPWVLADFLDFNDFLDAADQALDDIELIGTMQIASFHPRFQFDGCALDAIENFSNRSPYPMLHLLREDSVSRAVDTHPDIDSIPERNVETLRALGHDGWVRLGFDGAKKRVE